MKCVGSDVLWLVSIADVDFLENPIEGICREVAQISSDNEGMEWPNGLSYPPAAGTETTPLCRNQLELTKLTNHSLSLC